MNNINKNKKIAIIIPAYNEGLQIVELIESLHQRLSLLNITYKIIVIDDASLDDTSVKAKSSGAFVIKHLINMGSGGATATGLKYALDNKYNFAATIDGDFQHHPDDLVKGIEIIFNGQHDLLIGNRLQDIEGMPKLKILGNKLLSKFTRYVFGVHINDSQSGLRVFSEKALNKISWKTYGYGFCSEMIWRAKRADLIIDEFPIQAIYSDYSIAKGQNNWNAVNIVKSMLKCRIMEVFGE